MKKISLLLLLSDVLGRIRLTSIIENGTVALSNFEKGIYFMQAAFENMVSNHKLIKE